MTPTTVTRVIVDIISDLSRDLGPTQRYQRLLDGLFEAFPCDAAALLRLQGSELIPLAVAGLSDDTLGRRFSAQDEPRLARILMSREPVRFAADADLADPYDGLIETPEGELHVHDCMGVALHSDEVPWGVLTLDALTPGAFDAIDPAEFRTFIRLAEATIKVAELIRDLQARAEHEHQVAQTVIQQQTQHEIIGKSSALQALLHDIQVVAQSDLAVLVTGETGVGKELVARQLHTGSQRCNRPLVYLNCAALPENLVESELFGHARGAFSGADQARAGKFELANEGTLFLDEVGELPLATQPKLLRALQSGEVQRIGSDAQHQVDVRIVAATNRDLRQEVAAGRFRADLFHRLSAYPIHVPPLRERERDVLLLAGHFLEQARRRNGLRGVRLSRAAREALLRHDWPGNVRELEHLISRAVLRASASDGANGRSARVITIRPEELELPDRHGHLYPAETRATEKKLPPGNLRELTDDFQRQLLRRALQEHQGNKAATARHLGVDPGNLIRLLKRLQIS